LESDRLPAKKPGQTGRDFLKEPIFYLCSLTLFFYLAAEQGVIGWLVTYFKDTGLLGEGQAQLMASLLWVMILIGRLLVAYLSTKLPKIKLLLTMGIGLIGFFVLMISSQEPLWIMIGIMGFGLSMAGVYPTTVSFSGSLIQKSPMAWNLMLTTARLGAILMPTIIGQVAEAAGLIYGMSTIGASLIIVLILIIGLMLYQKKKEM
jgi:fucose permease